ncbi:hypothetical protein [Treponema brennaborense]|uniref:Cobalt transport protein n=1 Tax=Treponema brennaborense (strain DSM 12168 / CIP 105900 / DD5/3) TaxID=906968 RepID=F4LMR0_TREBD|nr:hypothetical protein [Treponema brennaborense]AEE17800.1 hypothetical protein Trebr_2392 [Treponema brennaborense DSM 12168]
MKLPVRVARACARFWETRLSARVLFVSALCCFPAFLFQQNTVVLACEAAVFFVLALTKRGSVRLLPPILVVAGVAFFSLLSPYGKVLFRVGDFTVTAGALDGGLRRGLMLAGMVFLSQLAVSPRLMLPGKAGAFLSRMFSYLDELSSVRVPFKRGQVIEAIDARLCAVYDGTGIAETDTAETDTVSDTESAAVTDSPQAPEKSGGTKFAGAAAAVLLPAVLYVLLFFYYK